MSKFKFIKPKIKESNFAIQMLATDSKKPIINALSNSILNVLNRPFYKNDKKYYSKISSMEVVKKLVAMLPEIKRFKKLTKGYFSQKEEFKLKVYSELYKLNNLEMVTCKKYKKYTWYQITKKGLNAILPIAESNWNEEIQENESTARLKEVFRKKGLDAKFYVELEKSTNGKVLVHMKAKLSKLIRPKP